METSFKMKVAYETLLLVQCFVVAKESLAQLPNFRSICAICEPYWLDSFSRLFAHYAHGFNIAVTHCSSVRPNHPANDFFCSISKHLSLFSTHEAYEELVKEIFGLYINIFFFAEPLNVLPETHIFFIPFRCPFWCPLPQWKNPKFKLWQETKS